MAVADRRGRSRGTSGETLVESLVAIAIVAIVGIAAYQGLQTIIRSSAQHRDSAVAETLLRNAAEKLQDPRSSYLALAGCGGRPTYAPAARAGYDFHVDVQFWKAPTTTITAPTPPTTTTVYRTEFRALNDCPAMDPGLQSVTLTVRSAGGFSEQLTFLKAER